LNCSVGALAPLVKAPIWPSDALLLLPPSSHAYAFVHFPSAPPDMLAVQCLPEWPAANVLLRLFAKALSSPKVAGRLLYLPASTSRCTCVSYAHLLTGSFIPLVRAA
jgi:hypothetical protein